jgi:hypothetical protein
LFRDSLEKMSRETELKISELKAIGEKLTMEETRIKEKRTALENEK